MATKTKTTKTKAAKTKTATSSKRIPRQELFFQTINAANRYAILWRLQTAKKPETRAKRMRSYIEMLEKGGTIH